MEITNKINEKIKKNLIDDELIEDIRSLREKGYTLKFNFDNKNLQNNHGKLKLIMDEMNSQNNSKGKEANSINKKYTNK
jgi:hypothetical protein